MLYGRQIIVLQTFKEFLSSKCPSCPSQGFCEILTNQIHSGIWQMVAKMKTLNFASVCPIRNVTACKLMEDTAIIGLPSYYNICPSQWKYQMKKNWLKTSMLYEHLISSVPYATPCPIHNIMIMLSVYWTTHQLLRSKIGFFLEI